MIRNIGSIDRAIRVVAGVMILSLVLVVPTPLGWLGIIPIVTGLIRFCPLYLPFNINTLADVER